MSICKFFIAIPSILQFFKLLLLKPSVPISTPNSFNTFPIPCSSHLCIVPLASLIPSIILPLRCTFPVSSTINVTPFTNNEISLWPIAADLIASYTGLSVTIPSFSRISSNSLRSISIDTSCRIGTFSISSFVYLLLVSICCFSLL